ncbi:DUF4861 domain-containing protein [Pontibacter qinzhouensis]|uniref:DUF4861 domain-containing protein n=1 Tax=Pontibacter qinzhouensis TaxID=2603253 RepID=A0A5C8K842_9BACT|nr:DUF4861 domain-containing protein [Pontibacter qinzhouensis]TXK49133.1 DUF4861 domain-containing protein [Pontibacter qinzhouensis]
MTPKYKSGFKVQLLLLLALFTLQATAQNLTKEFPKSFTVTVTNPLQEERQDVMVFLKADELKKTALAFNPKAFVVLDGKTEIASQYNSRKDDHEGLVVVLDKLEAGKSKKLTVRYNEKGEKPRTYTKRTQAELSHKVGGEFQNRKYINGEEFVNVDSLRVPDEVTDHSFFIRYEGPGWESDKVGYRFYLDWRNGTDVFGKTTKDMVLQNVGQDGYDSYHHLQDWGLDVLKVGKSLGVGTLAMFDAGKANRVEKTDSMISVIRENGNLYSSIVTDYYGWKVAGHVLDVNSRLNIHAGSRLTQHLVSLKGGIPQNLSTGVIKDKKAKLYTNKGSQGQWGYIASYGKQSLNGAGDNLGIAVIFRPQDFQEFTEDENSHIVKLTPAGGKLEYYFLAAWELEPEGITTEEEFLKYLDKTTRELASPVQVKIAKR